jgi:squalene synthase HpnC
MVTSRVSSHVSSLVSSLGRPSFRVAFRIVLRSISPGRDTPARSFSIPMTNDPAALRSGKGHRDENFPVASKLIHPRHRGIILAFYEFVRVADDMADHPTLKEREKLDLLDRLEAGLTGQHDEIAQAVSLRTALAERNLPPRHAQDLLTAFRMDVTKLRYRDWDDLMNYCSYSAMPVGRFVLDVHGEDRSTWGANDALCAALQIINHLQDCGKDFRDLNRVYVPLAALAASKATVDELGKDRSSPQLRQCLSGLALRTGELLDKGAPFSARIADYRLALEVAVIQSLARRLVGMLTARDPLSERVHLKSAGVAGAGLIGLLNGAHGRLTRLSGRHQPRSA